MQVLRILKKLFVVRSFAVLVRRFCYLCPVLLLCTPHLRADVTGSAGPAARCCSFEYRQHLQRSPNVRPPGRRDGAGNRWITRKRSRATLVAASKCAARRAARSSSSSTGRDRSTRIWEWRKTRNLLKEHKLNFRIEMFNVFNHANFTDVIGNANSGQFGQATNTASARIGQVSGKFIF